MKVVHSLRSLCVDYLIKHLANYRNIHDLPPSVKDRMLHKFLASPYYWKTVDFKATLASLTHAKTGEVDLTSAKVDDEILAILEGCSQLRKLYLTRVGEQDVSAEGLRRLFSKLKNLHTVRISNCASVDDAVVGVMARNCKQLAGLDVTGCKDVGDGALEALAPLENITWISLSGTAVTNEGVRTLVSDRSGPSIKELRLANCVSVNDAILRTIADNCPEITVLVFWNYQSSLDDIDLTNAQKDNLKNLKQFTWTISW